MHVGLTPAQIFEGLSSFQASTAASPATGQWNGVAIYDDYAHHPAEIEAALKAARGAAKGQLIAVMQPHRYSRLEVPVRRLLPLLRAMPTPC